MFLIKRRTESVAVQGQTQDNVNSGRNSSVACFVLYLKVVDLDNPAVARYNPPVLARLTEINNCLRPAVDWSPKGGRLLSTSKGAIYVFPTEAVEPERLCACLSEIVAKLRSSPIEVVGAITQGALHLSESSDRSLSWIGTAINDAARIASSTAAVASELYVEATAYKKLEPDLDEDNPLRDTELLDRPFPGKPHDPTPWSCHLVRIPPNLAADLPVPEEDSENHSGRYRPIIAYDLKGFSGTDGETMAIRANASTERVRIVLDNARLRGRLEADHVLPGGDGAIIVLATDNRFLAYDLARDIWAALDHYSSLLAPMSEVRARMTLTWDSAPLYMNAAGDQRPGGTAILRAEAALDGRAARDSQGLLLDKTVYDTIADNASRKRVTFEEVQGESGDSLFLDKSTLVHNLNERDLGLVRANIDPTKKPKLAEIVWKESEQLVPFGESRDEVARRVQRLFQRSRLVNSVEEVDAAERLSLSTDDFVFVTVAITDSRSGEILSAPDDYDRILKDAGAPDHRRSEYLKILSALVEPEVPLGVPHLICFNEHLFPPHDEAFEASIRHVVAGEPPITVLAGSRLEQDNWQLAHVYTASDKPTPAQSRLISLNPGASYTEVPSRRRVRVYERLFIHPTLKNANPLRFSVLQGKEILDPSLFLQVCHANNSLRPDQTRVSLVLVPCFDTIHQESITEACRDLSLLATSMVVHIRNGFDTDGQPESGVRCFLAGEEVVSSAPDDSTQSLTPYCSQAAIDVPGARGCTYHSVSVQATLYYLQHIYERRPYHIRDVQYFLGETRKEGGERRPTLLRTSSAQ